MSTEIDQYDPEWLKQEEEKIESGLISLAKNYDNNREKAYQKEKELNEKGSQVTKLLRYKCKTDLFFLCNTILGYDRLSPNLHGNFCRWIEINKKERFTEKLMPRATFKSTISTISDTIQCFLPFDELTIDEQKEFGITDYELWKSLNLPYPYDLGTDSRQLIVHEVATMASGYLFSITQQVMSNPMLMALYPEIIPTPKKHRINSKELVLPRTKIWNEPTVGTMGVGARSQGLHFDKIKFDDIMGKKAQDSETEMNSLRQWVDNIQAFFVRLSSGVLDTVGTRYGPDDVYAHIEDRYEGKLKVYRRAMEEPDLDDNGAPIKNDVGKIQTHIIFPEEVNEEDLNILKKNPVVYAAQYLNDPEGGNTKFDESWVKYFNWHLQDSAVMVLGGSVGLKKIIHVRDMYKLLLWDPALNGNTGWSLVGTDQYNRDFILRATQEVISAPNAVQKWFDLYAQYHFNALVIEEVLFSELFRHWLEAEFRLRGVRFRILPAKTRQESKEARVMGLSSPLSAGIMHFNEDSKYYSWTQDKSKKHSDMIYQIIKFGNIKEYHILDSLAYQPENKRTGGDPSRFMPDISVSNMESKLGKSNRTGYSTIQYK